MRRASLNRIEELYSKFGNVKVIDITPQEMRLLKNALAETKPSELLDGDSDPYSMHRMYLELLAKVRKSSAAAALNYGKNFLKTIHDLLSVGQNGLYSNELRFIYEIIQNADDCKYDRYDDCQLNFYFDFSGQSKYGRIVVNSNEKGFEPRNVFGLTGIAEESKNVTTDIEIGEKGIGFKSVFGITDTVLVQSGYFSFKLKNFDSSIECD